MNEKMFILACSKCKSINVIKKKMIECQDCGYVGDIFESTWFYDVIKKWKYVIEIVHGFLKEYVIIIQRNVILLQEEYKLKGN